MKNWIVKKWYFQWERILLLNTNHSSLTRVCEHLCQIGDNVHHPISNFYQHTNIPFVHLIIFTPNTNNRSIKIHNVGCYFLYFIHSNSFRFTAYRTIFHHYIIEKQCYHLKCETIKLSGQKITINAKKNNRSLIVMNGQRIKWKTYCYCMIKSYVQHPFIGKHTIETAKKKSWKWMKSNLLKNQTSVCVYICYWTSRYIWNELKLN